MVSVVVFISLFFMAVAIFVRKVTSIRKMIFAGQPVDIKRNKRGARIKKMLKVAVGQSKMVSRPIAGVFHILIYVGFLISSIELIEIVVDGITGQHRFFHFLPFYEFVINVCEFFAFVVIISCIVFLIRRNILKIRRFHSKEMNRWPKLDANLILIAEIILMISFFMMNASDMQLQEKETYFKTGHFMISGLIIPFLDGLNIGNLLLIERSFWWIHVVGILLFLNYIPYSKHFHIFLAFPQVYYSSLSSLGFFNNMPEVKKEVDLMMNPNVDSFAPQPEDDTDSKKKFGVQDVEDLKWTQLLSAFACTECGRCTSACPANITGKKLSPRKIMMDVKNRAIEKYRVKKNENIQKTLLGNYITSEELRACTTCNACSEACPLSINPLEIIVDLRRYLIMEKAEAPSQWTGMFSNIENNAAPWQFSQADRFKWKEEIN